MTEYFHGPVDDPYREENVVALDKYEDDRIWKITMNRPSRLNSIGGGLGSALTEAWEAFRDTPTARVAILTGAGRAFSAGADLKQTAEIREKVAAGGPAPYSGGRSWIPLAESLNMWKPTIAAINGYAIAGGFMMAMQCDIRIIAQSARVGIAEVRWNMGGAGWMAPLTRQMHLGHALELCIWGDEQWDADKCFRTGWANAVAADDQLDETAMTWARRILALAPRSSRNIKEALYRGPYMNPLESSRFGSVLEQNLVGMQDSIEGPKAFAERRVPNFIDG
jgi:E-phenylitaconyl-CoA hydratase